MREDRWSRPIMEDQEEFRAIIGYVGVLGQPGLHESSQERMEVGAKGESSSLGL